MFAVCFSCDLEPKASTVEGKKQFGPSVQDRIQPLESGTRNATLEESHSMILVHHDVSLHGDYL